MLTVTAPGVGPKYLTNNALNVLGENAQNAMQLSHVPL